MLQSWPFLRNLVVMQINVEAVRAERSEPLFPTPCVVIA